MEVDAHHCGSLISLAVRLSTSRRESKGFDGKWRYGPTPIEILGAVYEHGTPVALARNSIFKYALESVRDAEKLLWLDADCSIPQDQIPAIVKALEGADPICIIPTAQRNKASNVWIGGPEKRLESVMLDGKLRECYAGGFGCVAFDLEWYRDHWPEAPWFRDGWTTGLGYESEDYGHCRALVARGASVQYVGARVLHHARGGGEAL